jgi:hypothetical protein
MSAIRFAGNWLVQHPEVFGNPVDLFSFSFMTLEIVGWGRLKVIVEGPKDLLTAFMERGAALWSRPWSALMGLHSGSSGVLWSVIWVCHCSGLTLRWYQLSFGSWAATSC